MSSYCCWKIPAPILVGVIAMWIPLSVVAMTGIFCGVMAYAGLKVIFDNLSVDETWDEVE
jgi:hypothetical protein